MVNLQPERGGSPKGLGELALKGVKLDRDTTGERSASQLFPEGRTSDLSRAWRETAQGLAREATSTQGTRATGLDTFSNPLSSSSS